MNATIREVQRKLLVRAVASESVPASLRSLSTLTSSSVCREPRTSSLHPSRAELHHLPHSTHFFKDSLVRFSSAVSLDEHEDPPKKTRTNRSRNPLIVTPAAASRIHNLISNHNKSRDEGKAIGIRLGTKKRGCNGLSYTLDYAYENHSQQHKRDEVSSSLIIIHVALLNTYKTTTSSPTLEGHGYFI